MQNAAVTDQNQLQAMVNHVQFSALDDYRLSGIHYSASVPKKAALVIASATGVPQEFYRRFAEYMAKSGYDVLTFDYRGIGRSAPAELKNFKMDYLDWGSLDLAGAVDYFKQDGLPLFLIGHSYGGQALGLIPNHAKIAACYSVGTGTGWSGYMPYSERIKVKIIWNLVFPYMAARNGYIPWSKLNMGADLPLGVYKQWKHWCKNPEYFFGDSTLSHLKHQYADVKTPIFAATSVDDEWAMPASRDAFMKYYTNADMQRIDIYPHSVGMQKIGHMGYFRKEAVAIWDEMIQTFNQYLLA